MKIFDNIFIVMYLRQQKHCQNEVEATKYNYRSSGRGRKVL